MIFFKKNLKFFVSTRARVETSKVYFLSCGENHYNGGTLQGGEDP